MTEQQPPEYPEPLLVSVGEAAYLLSTSISTVRRLIRLNRIAAVHLTPISAKIPMSEIRSFIKREIRRGKLQKDFNREVGEHV